VPALRPAQVEQRLGLHTGVVNRIADLDYFEPQHIAVVLSRTLQIVHGNDVPGISQAGTPHPAPTT
jgi:hypothetical protein